MKLVLCLAVACVFAATEARRSKSQICIHEADGTLFPDEEGQCNRYIRCHNRWPIIIACPGKDTVYDHPHKACVTKDKALAPCGFLPREKPAFDCSQKVSGNYMAEERTCTPVFYQCHQGRSTRVECPKPYSYDPVADTCVPQSDNPLCQSNPCRERVDGNYAHPKGVCNEFLSCVKSWPILIECKPGHAWNDAEKRCMHRSLMSPPCGTYVPTTTTVATTEAPFQCNGKQEGNAAVPGTRCSQVFFQCHTNDVARVIVCPKGLAYHPIEDKCIDYERCLKDNPCHAKEDGLYAHPKGVCHEFLSCIKTWPIVIECIGNDQIWNDAEKRCMHRALVPPPCGTYTRPTTTTTVEPTTSPALKCDGNQEGNRAVPGVRCAPIFFQCHTNRVPRIIICPEGLAYHPFEDKCIDLDRCLKI